MGSWQSPYHNDGHTYSALSWPCRRRRAMFLLFIRNFKHISVWRNNEYQINQYLCLPRTFALLLDYWHSFFHICSATRVSTGWIFTTLPQFKVTCWLTNPLHLMRLYGTLSTNVSPSVTFDGYGFVFRRAGRNGKDAWNPTLRTCKQMVMLMCRNAIVSIHCLVLRLHEYREPHTHTQVLCWQALT